jgi:hypothetical protein
MARFELALIFFIDIQMYEHLTAATRASATSGNWRSPGLDMVLDQRVREYLLGLAMSPVAAGGFSTEQLQLLTMLPKARVMLGMQHAPEVQVPTFVECLQQSRQSISFFKVTVAESPDQSRFVFDNLRELVLGCCAVHTPSEVIRALCESLQMELSHFISEGVIVGSISTWQRVRCNGSDLRNFADVGTFVWYHSSQRPSSSILGKDLGRLLFVCRWKEQVLVLLQRAVIAARSADYSGPNSSLSACRVRLVDEFDIIVRPDIQATFRCACVHHDCVRSQQVNRGASCRIERAAGVLQVSHFHDDHFFLNPGWHSVNNL